MSRLKSAFIHFCCASLLAGCLAGAAFSDNLVQVTSQSAQASNDSISWSQLGIDQTSVGTSFPVQTVNRAIAAVALAVGGSIAVVVCAGESPATSSKPKQQTAAACSWTGGTGGTSAFTAGDTLLWAKNNANGGSGPLTITFTTSISGAGALVQANVPGQFTVQIQQFNGTTPLGTFTQNSDTAGDPVYIGFIDQTGPNVTSFVISLTACQATTLGSDDCNDFAIDTVFLNRRSTTASPTASLTSPSQATGTGPISFVTAFSTENGKLYTDLTSAYVLVNSSLTGKSACYFWYYQPTNSLLMINDMGTAWQTPVNPGVSTGTLSNAQCSLDVTDTKVSGTGNTLTLTLPVTASSTFVGTQNIYLFAYDSEGLGSGWTHQSAWTWTPHVFKDVPPTASLTSPSQATGTGPISFVAASSTQNGKLHTDLTSAYVLINTSLSGKNACYFWYYHPTNSLLMINDTGTAWQTPAVHPNVSTGTLSNAQCSLNVTGTTVSGTGSTLILTLPVTASNTLTGKQNVYLFVYDSEGSGSGWVDHANWTWTP